MSDLNPINLDDPSGKTRTSPAQAGRKIVVVVLAAVIVSSMIAWCGLLGWGVVELLRWTLTAFYKLWTASF